MNSKSLSTLLFAAGLAVLATWWWRHSENSAAPVAHGQSVARPVSVATTKLNPEPAELPVADPAEPETLVDPAPAAPQPATPDPLMDLQTAIPELIRLMASRDYAALLELYPPFGYSVQTPPEVKAMLVQQMAEDPGVQDRLSAMLMALQSTQGMTPVYDATGEQATFPSVANPKNNPSTPPKPLTFTKINGRWLPP